jgi:hypothetical protein
VGCCCVRLQGASGTDRSRRGSLVKRFGYYVVAARARFVGRMEDGSRNATVLLIFKCWADLSSKRYFACYNYIAEFFHSHKKAIVN